MTSDRIIQEKLRQCYRFGMENSTDQSTKLGALLVHTGWNLAVGCNHHVPGYGNQPSHHMRPDKYLITEHAERDVIFKAVSDPKICHYLSECTLVAPWVACPDCARAIVLCGIKQVVCHKQCMERTPKAWEHPIKVGLDILFRGGVVLTTWDGGIGDIKHLMNGEIWNP